MCLAVPGKLIEITDHGELTRSGRVDFGGVIRPVNLALVPETEVGEYVLVHVGIALSRIDEEEAHKTLAYLQQIDELAELRPLPRSSEPADREPDPPGP
jgi:hydrogenase expression/formation protein HypC